MKHSRVSPSLPSSLSLVLCGLTVLSASAVRAAECPASSPDRTEERRALAKEWFARAEAAENANNDVEAVRAYACSMKMVAHAFTAFNLGRVAERSGDLELALKSYKAYLTLKADAPDKDEVQNKIADLQAKIKEVKENVGGTEPAATEPGATAEKPEEGVAPPPEKLEKPLPIEPPPYVTEQAGGGGGGSRILVWVVGGVGVAALGTGIITNIMARNDMSTCTSKADGGYLAQAKAACDSAKPAAYTSYVMFGVAGAAAVVEGILLYRVWSRSSGGDSSDDTSVRLGWLPGGLSLSARGRF
jgi:tetratricopeptide (TPR) repeat protein